eukprot:tig00020961_g16630.t1
MQSAFTVGIAGAAPQATACAIPEVPSTCPAAQPSPRSLARPSAETAQPLRRSFFGSSVSSYSHFDVAAPRLRFQGLDVALGRPVRQPVHEFAAYASAEAPKKREYQANTFTELGLREELVAGLESLQIHKPTKIQSKAIPQILRGFNVVAAAETGSGKTLAYLLPVIDTLKQQEEIAQIERKPMRPRAIVLVPNRELGKQVLSIAKQLSHFAKIRAVAVMGGESMKKQAEMLQTPVDILVCTPGRLLQLREKGAVYFTQTRHVVIDEVDTMFDAGFAQDLRAILVPIRGNEINRGAEVQFVLVTATIKKAIEKLLEEKFPDAIRISTAELHAPVATLKQEFIPVASSEKRAKLVEMLELSGYRNKKRRAIVFCNTMDSCRATDHFLNEMDFETACYHGEMPVERRTESFEAFKSGEKNILVCTDIAARGLDYDVDHVIIFDFPRNRTDYLHRAGRTARAGNKGTVTSLVTKRDMTLANAIRDGSARGEDLLEGEKEPAEIAAEREAAAAAAAQRTPRPRGPRPGPVGDRAASGAREGRPVGLGPAGRARRARGEAHRERAALALAPAARPARGTPRRGGGPACRPAPAEAAALAPARARAAGGNSRRFS